MNKNALIGIAVALPFLGYILFSDSFNEQPKEAVQHDSEQRTNDYTLQTDQTRSFVPEGYRRLDDGTILIDVAVLPGTLNALWAVYGIEPDPLHSTTSPTTNGLGAGGMGVAGQYGSYSIPISPSALQPGVSYFYRVAGETTEGEILYSGLNRFTAGK